jgi:16S rRNA (guanine527-N7)-methyltransferase
MTSISYIEIIERESSNIGCPLTQDAMNKLELYLRELMRWNQKTNLTGHKEEREIIANLFIDSIAFHKVLSQEGSVSVLDVGSGAGFPGLPLKIYDPRLCVTLVEPNLKKVAFLHHIIGTLGLKTVFVESKRIEEIPNEKKLKNTIDWVFLKALRYEVCLPYVTPLLSERGKVVLSRPKKHADLPNLTDFTVEKVVSYPLPFGFGERELIVLSPALS